MDCIECSKSSSYKCPTCRQPYCSVACCKRHKLKPCSPPEPTPVAKVEGQATVKYDFPTEDTVPPDSLKLLEQSKDVKSCLENPHVREILKTIDNSLHPDELMQEFMQEPIFTEFVDACLKIVQPQEEDGR